MHLRYKNLKHILEKIKYFLINKENNQTLSLDFSLYHKEEKKKAKTERSHNIKATVAA